MLLAATSFLASAWPHFAWLLGWRLAAGLAGGRLMVLAAPTVFHAVPVRRRGLAAGLIFAGAGLHHAVGHVGVGAGNGGATHGLLALGLLCLAASGVA